jgi:hypothetical protein
MSESIASMLENIRAEIRSAEHDAVAIKERLATLLRMEAMLEAQQPRPRGRPRVVHRSEPEDIVA